MNSLTTAIYKFFLCSTIFVWDIVLSFGNLVRFKRPVGKVTPEGHPGYGGYWPEYRPPKEGDSRCCCPGLNTMANHGIIARSGRGIKFTDVNEKINLTYNFGPSFCSYTTHYAAFMLKRSHSKDTFDLEEIDLHNGIEHDASLTRLDTEFQPKQAEKHVPYIEELLSFATGDNGSYLKIKDMSRILSKRRAESKANNPNYSQAFSHKLFGSANSASMLRIFGGRTDDLRTILLEERLPEGWESRVREPYGLTMLALNTRTTLPLEWGVDESKWADKVKQDNEQV
ncbi:Chloroperoxidase [Pisolithus orientalis]|uniref:Chloroperoxidase n=1 Tax=Pisolithus orientalis TaxID=936130 RepID=UPI00222487CF|nr:Chloroperoxidase [Pisolithus orientalis]KAI6015113.1 Chloroperoxidase [Pisolithus orientalis]